MRRSLLGVTLGTALVAGFGAACGSSETASNPTATHTTATAMPTAAAPSPTPEARPTGLPRASADDPAISVLHLIVAHDKSLLGKRKSLTRSAEAAKQRAEEARARVVNGEDFAAIASQYSDEPRAAEGKGSPLKFRYKDAVKAFADAAFALNPGEVSPVTQTPSGFQVIKRIE